VIPSATGMPFARKLVCVIYALVALLALVGTWRQNLAYMQGGAGPLEINARFWADVFTGTPATTSIAVDLFMLGLAVTVWMVLEARRLEVRFVWLYVVVGLLVAISVTVPLFLIARERRLHGRAEGPPRVGIGDLIGLGLLVVGVVGAVAWTMVRRS
jgi:hypothetical protein